MPSVINFGNKESGSPVTQQLKMNSGKIDVTTGSIISDEFDCPQGEAEFDCGYDSNLNHTN